MNINGGFNMRKKIIASLIFALAIALFSGCAEKKTTSTKDYKLQNGEVCINDIVFSIRTSFDKIKDDLGEPVKYQESKSCLYDGFDKIYQYSDLIISTYPLEKKEYISSIILLNENKTITYNCNVKIGDSMNDVKTKLKGKELITSSTCYQLEETDMGFAFYFEGETVSKIEIYSIAE